MSTPTNKWKIAAGVGVACAACCAPLLAPLLLGAGGAGLAGGAASGFLGASWGEIACVAIFVALAASAAVLLVQARARMRKPAACACQDNASEGASCAVGGPCGQTEQ